MTTEQQLRSDFKTSKMTRTTLKMIAGGAFGFFGVLAVERLIGLDVIFDSMSPVGILAVLMALVFSLIGIICLAMAGSRKMYMLGQADGEAAATDFDEMRPLLLGSAIGIFLYAATLVLLTIASITDGQQLISFWSIFGLMVAQTLISVMLWKKYDELYREVMKDSCAVTFVIVEFGLLIWAAATICGLDVTFDPLGVIVAITGINVVTSAWFTIKRGIA